MDSHFSEEPGMQPVVYALIQLHRIVLFSNTNAAHVAHIKANYQVFGHVHAAYLSHELGLVKPDATSFLKLLEIEGLPPEDCIFFIPLATEPPAGPQARSGVTMPTNVIADHPARDPPDPPRHLGQARRRGALARRLLARRARPGAPQERGPDDDLEGAGRASTPETTRTAGD
jgi:hypothetical protein